MRALSLCSIRPRRQCPTSNRRRTIGRRLLTEGSKMEVRLAGHIFLTSVLDYVLARPPAQRTPLYLFVDEASFFPSVALARALSEGRKFGLHLFVANQSIFSSTRTRRCARRKRRADHVQARTPRRPHARPAHGRCRRRLTGLPNLHALVQLPGRSAFTVRLDPPDSVDELPHYSPPKKLASVDGSPRNKPLRTREQRDAGESLQVKARARRRALTQRNAGQELWSRVLERLNPDPSMNPRRNSWTRAVVSTQLSGDRFEILVEHGFMREWILERRIDLLQTAVTEITEGESKSLFVSPKGSRLPRAPDEFARGRLDRHRSEHRVGCCKRAIVNHT